MDHSWGSHLCNAHWNTLLDVFTVFAVILLILGLIDLCSSRRPRNKRDVHVVRQLSEVNLSNVFVCVSVCVCVRV